jgi:2-polyprenyl-3-methyl-5-hydroxy-6-metoxy-1,4-benzoquinol methylase
MELTSKKYWEDYYQEASESRETIIKICGAYDYFWEMLTSNVKHQPQSIIEIGAFPGRYLAYLSSRYNLEATGLDFNPDREKFSRSMQAMGVEKYDYICSDFLAHQPQQQYDIVFSNGFIEHFTNYGEILDKHASYLKAGGAMMVMIPNKRYLRKIYGYFLDRKNLKAHNLECMRLDVFKEFAKRNNLRINFLSYYGGFGFKVHQPLSFLQRLVYAPIRLLSIKLHDEMSKNPSKWYSGTIIGIFSKPVDE